MFLDRTPWVASGGLRCIVISCLLQLPAAPVTCARYFWASRYIYIYIYIYVARTERKGADGHICVFVEHICILQALQTYIYDLYICLPCLFVCIYAFCLLHVCKWVQISANVCSVAHQCSPQRGESPSTQRSKVILDPWRKG